MELTTALQVAARIWRDPEFSRVAMDTGAAVQIANILLEVANRPTQTSNAHFTFEVELIHLLNKHGVDNDCDTPDFIVGEYVVACLAALGQVVKRRDQWLARPTAASQISRFDDEQWNQQTQRS